MKVLGTVLKILTALAAIAGIVYVVATYGDKIVAWTKKLLGIDYCEECCGECCCDACDDCGEACCEKSTEEAAEEPAEEPAPAEEGTVEAEEADFEG